MQARRASCPRLIERRPILFTGSTPFVARVPLREIERASTGRSQGFLGGSSLTLDLSSGEQLRFDVRTSRAGSAELADALVAASRSAAGSAGARGINVVSADPPPRTCPQDAGALMLLCLPPFALSLFAQAIIAFVTSAAAFMFARILWDWRPPWMRRALGIAMGLVALAFVVDAVVAAQPVRLLGTVYPFGAAVWMLRWE